MLKDDLIETCSDGKTQNKKIIKRNNVLSQLPKEIFIGLGPAES